MGGVLYVTTRVDPHTRYSRLLDNVFICSTTEPILPRLKAAPLRGCPDEPAAERNETTSSIGPRTTS